MNLYEITKNIEKLASAEHVSSIYEGDIYDLNKQQDIRYPVFVITQQSHAGSTNDKIKIGYNLFFVDRLLEDKSNQLEIQDWAIRATENVIEGITAANLGYVSDNYTINTFTERFDSLCAGAVCQMQVNVSVDNCDVPRIVTSIMVNQVMYMLLV